jgi:hypothetical protein
MRITTWACAGLVCAAAGCVSETRVITDRGVPGTAIASDEGVTSEEKTAKSEEWLEELTMEGVKEANHRGHTVFLLKQLLDYRPQSTAVVLAKGVDHPSAKVRENSAFFLSYARDRRAQEALINMLDDSAESVRLGAAASLITGYNEKAGVPVLLRALYSETLHFRREAVKNLRIYSQMYFAYSPTASRSERDFCAGHWEKWWRENGDTFQSPIIGRPRPR